MANKLLNAIFKFVIGIVGALLSPIETLIERYVPQLNDLFSMISSFFNFVMDFIIWVLSWFHIPSAIFTATILIVVAKIVVGQTVHVIKVAFAWWRTLKL